MTLIAFIGSVFSPYYALARHLGRGDPYNHCAINVALYGSAGKRWAMTERTRDDLECGPFSLRVGPSSLRWSSGRLNMLIDERTVPLPSRIRGGITLVLGGRACEPVALDHAGRHVWHPLAPRARIEVDLENPKLRWSGDAYLDRNFGAEPLESAFTRWTWSRAHCGEKTYVLYDVERRDGTHLSLAHRFNAVGLARDFKPPREELLPSTFWRVQRTTRSDAGFPPRVLKTLEDTPFYARSLIESTLDGERMTAVHESLSLDRVAHPVVRLMLPFRMPRRRSRAQRREPEKGPTGLPT
jgi:carotenoid 1,2-hydratase